ncbi:Membrane protein involved in the export of O-antigen and teichoic acid [Pseudomonas benzenivorans]|nr:Membrane protein involved in the export of O-antigen and teichoic acid [Pseudomonas benzenivorans]
MSTASKTNNTLSLKINIIANYASQLYVTAVGILILPLYIKYMGAEAYGLVGFFTMLQACFFLLDIGLTPTIGRETARYHGGAMSALAYRQMFRALSIIFVIIAVIGGGGLWLLSEVVATSWLNVTELPMGEVVLAVQIMGISVALRWMGGLYRGVITGSERLVWLSGFNVFIATLRFIAVFASMGLYGFSPFVFFIHQLVVALVEILCLFMVSRRLLPSRTSLSQAIGWSFSPVRPLLKFALTIAFTSSVWVLVTQTDKFVLSGILPLAEYGYFTLAVLVASSIIIISSPISSAIMPRMARLHAEGKHEELIQIYRSSTQLISVVVGSTAITLATCAEQLLFAWTGDTQLAEKAAPILQLYAIGNGFLAITAFPYYLQYAKGNLRYHLIGNIVMVGVLIPVIMYFAYYFGGVGAGYVWLGMNCSYLLIWTAYVHHKLEPRLHFPWLVNDIAVIVLPAVAIVIFIFIFELRLVSYGRIEAIAYCISTGVLFFVGSALVSQKVRNMLSFWIKNIRVKIQSGNTRA